MEDTLPIPPPKAILNNKIILPLPPKKIILGGEYANLATPRKPTKKDKKKIDNVIDKLKEQAEGETEFVYEGGVGVYLPTFKSYVDAFWDIIKNQTNVKSDYEAFKDTSLYERYMLNCVQFSAAKDVATNGMMKTQLFNDKGERKGFSEFKSDCKEITDITNDTWLRTEYDTSVRQVVAGQQFKSFQEDSDLYGFWQYLETTSAHPRDEHLLLVGNIYKIGDPESDDIFPPNGFNCSCSAEQIDDQYLKDNNKSVRTNEEAGEDLKNGVPEQFRFNPYKSGILPKESHSYFQALPSANSADGETFGITGTTKNSDKLAAKGLHLILKKVDEWKHEFHSDLNTITFQNKATLSNIKFTHKALLTIEKHSAGFEQLADTVTKPQEIWSSWANVKEQLDVKRVYIKGNYCVMTTNGIIQDAYLVDNVNRFRKGCIILT